MHAGGDDPLGECRQWRGRVERGEVVGPAIFYNGPMLDGPSPVFPSSVALGSVHHVARELDRLARGGASFVKVYDLMPREIFLEAAREARRRRLPLAGHVPVAVPIEEAVAAGLRGIEHLTGYFEAANPRREELASRMQLAAGLWRVNRAFAAESMRNIHLQMAAAYNPALAEPLFKLFRDKGIFHCPTLVALRRHGVEAAIGAAGDLHRAGVKLLAGTDAGNEGIEPGASLHEELELLVEAGLTPLEALAAATLRPAEFFGLERSMGTIERGKTADLALLDADPSANIRNVRRVSRVWLRGNEASHHLQDQALQVVCLRHGEQDGMIPGLCAPLEHAQRLARVERGFGHRFQQHCLAHVE
jgi:imidazolonepropionase-like amidohydrolase